MKPVDPDSGRPRGYALLSFIPASQKVDYFTETELSSGNSRKSRSLINSCVSPAQPTSILFRSKMNASEKRRKYKEYLQSLMTQLEIENEDLPFEVVHAYWCKDGQLTSTWDIIEPMKARDEEVKELAEQVRSLLSDVKRRFAGASGITSKKCCHGISRSCFTPEEALDMIYLASIPEERRREIVMNAESLATELVREELLKEAALISSAIEIADQVSSFEN
jgi:hypothetical protein